MENYSGGGLRKGQKGEEQTTLNYLDCSRILVICTIKRYEICPPYLAKVANTKSPMNSP